MTITAFGSTAAREQKFALDRLLMLEHTVKEENSSMVEALTGYESPVFKEYKRLKSDLANVGVKYNEHLKCYTAALPIWD